jgi:glycosyltransferase involved in cell wall biosynthesis
MHIGIDARALSSRFTGISFYLKSILDELQWIDIDNRYTLISNTCIDYILTNSKWKKIEGKFKSRFVGTAWMQLVGPRIASKNRIELFWSPRHHLPAFFLPSRIKTILTVHDVVHRRFPQTMSLPNLLVERCLMKISLKRADAIITDSMSTAKDLIHYYEDCEKKINVIYPGCPHFPNVTTSCLSAIDGLPSKFFLFVGTLDPRKNIYRILQAFEKIAPENKNVHLVMVGAEGWKNKDFKAAFSRHPHKSLIHLKGYVSRQDLASYYYKAIGLLFPSLYEGFGFPILEAMHAGTPVITSKTSSMPEVAGEAAIHVDPYDVDSIAKAMCDIYEDSFLRDRLRNNGYERIKRFSWKVCSEQLRMIFHQVFKN